MVELVPIGVDERRFARLLQLYLHEWSGLLPLAIGIDASYQHPELHLYRDAADRAAFLFLDAGDGSPLCFALVHGDAGCWRLKDFFVIAGARRRGVGRHAASALFATCTGRWTLTVRPENPRALAFWRAIEGAVGQHAELGHDGVERTRFWYASPDAADR